MGAAVCVRRVAVPAIEDFFPQAEAFETLAARLDHPELRARLHGLAGDVLVQTDFMSVVLSIDRHPDQMVPLDRLALDQHPQGLAPSFPDGDEIGAGRNAVLAAFDFQYGRLQNPLGLDRRRQRLEGRLRVFDLPGFLRGRLQQVSGTKSSAPCSAPDRLRSRRRQPPQEYGHWWIEQSCLPPLGKGCRHAEGAPETLPVGETGVARARANRPEGDHPTCTSLLIIRILGAIASAEGRGDRPIRRRSRFTLARARAEPLALDFACRVCGEDRSCHYPAMTRRATPKATETAVLVKSRRRCCLCYGLDRDLGEKPGQIAHLNQRHDDTREDNLAFLCLPHHDAYDSRTSQRKGLTEAEVKTYRDALYAHFAESDAAKTRPDEPPVNRRWRAVGFGQGWIEIRVRDNSGGEFVVSANPGSGADPIDFYICFSGRRGPHVADTTEVVIEVNDELYEFDRPDAGGLSFGISGQHWREVEHLRQIVAAFRQGSSLRVSAPALGLTTRFTLEGAHDALQEVETLGCNKTPAF